MFSKFTINSTVFLGLTLFTVSAALYFRNPLLVYTAIFLVTVNVFLYIWAQYSVHGLEIQRISPHLAIATKPATIRLVLTNHRSSSRYAILGFDLHKGLVKGSSYTPVAYLEAPAGIQVETSYEVTPQRRGIFELGPFFLYGGDPFGFYKCWRKVDLKSEMTVLPCPASFTYYNPASVSQLAQDELETIPVGGASTEFLGVREYVQGEPLKHVHWPSTARMGQLISRQYELNVAASISTLLLAEDVLLEGSEADNPLEYSLSMIAGIGSATASERFQFSYLGIEGSEQKTHSGTGRQSYQELAVKLSRTHTAERSQLDDLNRRILAYLPAGSRLIVFAPDGGKELYDRLERLRISYRVVTLVTFDQRSFSRRLVPERPGPLVTYSSGLLIYKVFFKDNLSHVLNKVFAQTANRGGAA
jgi:uncharacterized protein (DUF58 family)